MVPIRNDVADSNVAAKERVKSTAAVRHKTDYVKSLALAAVALLLTAPAHAEPPDIADLVGVHQEMRRAATIPEPTWPLRDGVWDCEDNARWARALLEARGWPRERLGIYLGLDIWGRPHAVLCASGEGLDEPICLDRVWSSVVPLSAYGDGWHEVDLP